MRANQGVLWLKDRQASKGDIWGVLSPGSTSLKGHTFLKVRSCWLHCCLQVLSCHMSESDEKAQHTGNVTIEGRTIPGNKRHKMPTESELGQRVLMPRDSLPCLFSRFLGFYTSTLRWVITVPSSNPPMPFRKQRLLLWPCSHLRWTHACLAEKHTWSLPFFSSSADNHCILCHHVLVLMSRLNLSLLKNSRHTMKAFQL